MRGTICFITGIILVLIGWSIIGILIEGFGVINLFGNFFPIAFAFIKRAPIIGPLFNNKYVEKVVNKFTGGEGLPIYSNKGN